MTLILASTSPYRRALLERLGLTFDCVPPGTAEIPRDNEAPEALAGRLALEKAEAVAAQYPQAVVIGSDQVAALDGTLLHKPGDHARATTQLLACSGRQVDFHTGVAVVAPGRTPAVEVVPFTVHFRTLSAQVIDRYLRREQPYDCAGSFKVEALGIALFERLAGDDPTSLEGLPLIATCRLLEEAGIRVI
jgi:septum formation protein